MVYFFFPEYGPGPIFRDFSKESSVFVGDSPEFSDFSGFFCSFEGFGGNFFGIFSDFPTGLILFSSNKKFLKDFIKIFIFFT